MLKNPSINIREGEMDQIKQQAGKIGVNGWLTITTVAERLGISVKTITRWEKAGKIRKAHRDWRGWRVYAPEDIEELKSFFQTVY